MEAVSPRNDVTFEHEGICAGLSTCSRAPIRIHVGDNEVLLDDSRRYFERAIAAGVDARLDVWTGRPHGFPAGIGAIKASAQALGAMGMFLAKRLQS